jgi:hypothetical protein
LSNFDFALGFVFTVDDFPLPVEKQNTVTKVLNNMVAAGQIRRLSNSSNMENAVFKGGTSLSKCYRLISRFFGRC